jgi:enoyl-CoA hydratase/carnithine racemase
MTMSKNNTLFIEQKGYVCTLTLNRPEKRNALSPDLLIKLCQTLEALSQNDDVRTIVIRGSGNKAFSSGYDVAALPTEVPEDLQERLEEENPLDMAIGSILNFPYPVIAMLNGYAFGAGCELALNCDIRIAADEIKMGIPAAKLGLVYPMRGMLHYVQTVGFTATSELLLTGRSFNAQRALEMGLINYALPRTELETFTYDLAREIAGNAPLSLKGTKRILGFLRQSFKMPENLLAESERIIAQAFNSEDLKEGQKAFLEKRKPVFKGR